MENSSRYSSSGVVRQPGGNFSIICQSLSKGDPEGMWIDYQNSLQYTTPLFMAQLCIVSLAYLVIKYALKPLRQASIISQVLSGVLLGPSILGQNDFFRETFFPQRGAMLFETVAGFGLLIFLFGVGVEMETGRMFRPSRTAVIAGIFMVVFSSLLTVPMAVLLTRVLTMNESLKNLLPIFAVSQCTSAFPSVCPFLKDRKIINTDPGRIAISISLFSDLIGMSLAIVNYSLQPLLKDSIGQPVINTIGGLISALSFVSILAFIIRPLILKLLVRLPQEKPVSESYIMAFFILFLACSLVTEVIGQHFAFGALAAGIVIPPGPPLGSTIVRRLEYPIATFSFPTFLTNSGLKTNIFFIQSHHLLVVCIIVLYAAVIKVVIMLVLGKFLAISRTESVVIGLMLNAKGPTELILFNLWSDVQANSERRGILPGGYSGRDWNHADPDAIDSVVDEISGEKGRRLGGGRYRI
nr:cation/H(+) antiporter 15-like [Ipomoea batatas]